jgi:hypothetical protein
VLVVSDSVKYYPKWEAVTIGVPPRICICSLLFLLYVNDLPNAISELFKPVLFADDTSLIIANPNIQRFGNGENIVLEKLNRWFSSNLLLLYPEKKTIFYNL